MHRMIGSKNGSEPSAREEMHQDQQVQDNRRIPTSQQEESGLAAAAFSRGREQVVPKKKKNKKEFLNHPQEEQEEEDEQQQQQQGMQGRQDKKRRACSPLMDRRLLSADDEDETGGDHDPTSSLSSPRRRKRTTRGGDEGQQQDDEEFSTTATPSTTTTARSTNKKMRSTAPHSRENAASATPLQSKWDEMFQRLVAFRKKHGNCLVPNRYADDPQLGSWVSTQRRQYKLLRRAATGGGGREARDGGSSGGVTSSESSPSMTAERANKLMSIGFEWSTKDPRHVPWEHRYSELRDFVEKYGHAQVPIGWEENVQLSNWVSTQRQEYKLLSKGRSSRLTSERINLLNNVGFVWEAQRGGPRRRKKATRCVPPQATPVGSARANLEARLARRGRGDHSRRTTKTSVGATGGTTTAGAAGGTMILSSSSSLGNGGSSGSAVVSTSGGDSTAIPGHHSLIGVSPAGGAGGIVQLPQLQGRGASLHEQAARLEAYAASLRRAAEGNIPRLQHQHPPAHQLVPSSTAAAEMAALSSLVNNPATSTSSLQNLQSAMLLGNQHQTAAVAAQMRSHAWTLLQSGVFHRAAGQPAVGGGSNAAVSGAVVVGGGSASSSPSSSGVQVVPQSSSSYFPIAPQQLAAAAAAAAGTTTTNSRSTTRTAGGRAGMMSARIPDGGGGRRGSWPFPAVVVLPPSLVSALSRGATSAGGADHVLSRGLVAPHILGLASAGTAAAVGRDTSAGADVLPLFQQEQPPQQEQQENPVHGDEQEQHSNTATGLEENEQEKDATPPAERGRLAGSCGGEEEEEERRIDIFADADEDDPSMNMV